jgi:hypothetical protein
MEKYKHIVRNLTLPDAINCSMDLNFTQIPNSFLRNPNISSKAKIVLCILLSNKEGWHSYISTLKGMMKEGESTIREALQELEKFEYLLRLRYRIITTKVLKGSFWAYTNIPGQFNIKYNINLLKSRGYEVINIPLNLQNIETQPRVEKPRVEKPRVENQRLIILNNKNTKQNKIKVIYSIFLEKFPKEWKENISFQESLTGFITHRIEKGLAPTDESCKRNAKKLLKYSIYTAIKALENSIENSYTGVFPESVNEKNYSNYSGRNNSSKRIYKSALISNFRDSDKIITNIK